MANWNWRASAAAGWLTGGVSCARQGISKRLSNRDDVGAIEKVKNIGYEVESIALANVDALGNAGIELEEHRHGCRGRECRCSRAVGAIPGNRKRSLGVGPARGRKAERDARKRKGEVVPPPKIGRASEELSSRRSVFTGDYVEGQAGRNFHERGQGPIVRKVCKMAPGWAVFGELETHHW